MIPRTPRMGAHCRKGTRISSLSCNKMNTRSKSGCWCNIILLRKKFYWKATSATLAHLASSPALHILLEIHDVELLLLSPWQLRLQAV